MVRDGRITDSGRVAGELDRREFLKSLGAVTVGGVLADLEIFDRAASAAKPGDRRRPNIVFVLVDELRIPSVFPQGVSTPQQFLKKFMPNTFELARHGVRFDNHFTAGVACSPARGVLVTGLYAQQEWLLATRVENGPSLQSGYPTYGKLLRRLGYDTPYIGKWHLSDAPEGATTYLNDYGFDGMTVPDIIGSNGDGERRDPGIGDQTVAWLEQRRASQGPFCLTVSFVNPHDKQYFWGGSEGTHYEALFAGQTLKPMQTDLSSIDKQDNPPPLGYPTVPPNWESEAQLRRNKPSGQTLFRTFLQASFGAITDDPKTVDFAVAPSPMFPGQLGLGMAPFSYWQRGMDMYTYVMSLVDEQVGRIVAAMPAKLLDNTVFVLCADHGEFAGAHGFLSGKMGTVYDEAYHVPLIVTDPSGRFVNARRVPRKQLTSSVDFAPMLVTLGNRGSRSWMKGDLAQIYRRRLDLVSLLQDPKARGRDYVLFSSDEIMTRAMNYLNAPAHILGVRTHTEKLGAYMHWLPGTTRPTRAGMELEYYDRTTRDGRAETESNPDDPRAKVLLNKLLREYLPREMRRPLPAPLHRTALRGRASYLAFNAVAEALTAKDLLDGRKITDILGYGRTI